LTYTDAYDDSLREKNIVRSLKITAEEAPANKTANESNRFLPVAPTPTRGAQILSLQMFRLDASLPPATASIAAGRFFLLSSASQPWCWCDA
jgi:hypothetical protein